MVHQELEKSQFYQGFLIHLQVALGEYIESDVVEEVLKLIVELVFDY